MQKIHNHILIINEKMKLIVKINYIEFRVLMILLINVRSSLKFKEDRHFKKEIMSQIWQFQNTDFTIQKTLISKRGRG